MITGILLLVLILIRIMLTRRATVLHVNDGYFWFLIVIGSNSKFSGFEGSAVENARASCR
jgi:hypothetical protein